MKSVLLALAAVAAITVGSSFMNTAQAGHGHHHGHHHPHHGHHGHFHRHHHHGHHHHSYYYRPVYPYGYSPYYGSGIGIYGKNFGFRIGY